MTLTVPAYRLLYNMVHDFRTNAILVESEIKKYGVRHDNMDPIPPMKGRRHAETWVSMKAVSHFNLGTALELMFKLILVINRTDLPQTHSLSHLYNSLPAEWQRRINSKYREAETECGACVLAAVRSSDTPNRPEGPENRDISSLRAMLAYFDADVVSKALFMSL